MLATSVSPVTVSHLCLGQIRDSEWACTRHLAHSQGEGKPQLALGALTSTREEIQPWTSHQMLTLISTACWKWPCSALTGRLHINVCCWQEPQIFLNCLSMYEAASSMKMGPGGTLRKGVKCQIGLGLKIQHQPHSPVPSKPRAWEWKVEYLYSNDSIYTKFQFSSVASDSLWPHESQHARPPCPSQTPGVYSNSCPSSRWCHPAILSSVIPFSSCPWSLPASGSFPTSQLFAWGGQSIGVSASASVLPMNTQDWSPSGWTGWSSLQSRGLS